LPVKARLLPLTLILLSALPAFSSISVESIKISLAGIQNLGGQERIKTSVHMTYIGLLGNPAVTDWITVHAIEDAFTTAVYATTGRQTFRASEYSSGFSAWGNYSSCYRGSAIVEAGGNSQSVRSSALCTPPRQPRERPCEIAGDCPGDIEKTNCPLIVNTGNAPWRLSGIDNGVLFDIDADGTRDRMGWTAAGSPLAFVAIDRNGNGAIDDARELFGDFTPLGDGSPAGNGFVALGQYDLNHDGVVNTGDPVWRSLLLWTDTNHDGASDGGELTPIAASDIAGLGVEYHRTGRVDEFGNEFRFQSKIIKTRGREPYYDIFFRADR
jgi:hypothetical protein